MSAEGGGMTDLFWHQTPPQPFKDIRSTRPSVAEQKAELALQLGRLIARCPPGIANGSINATREWVAARKQAAATAKSTRSSVQDLTAAISNMERFK
jgi:hypothetical protein